MAKHKLNSNSPSKMTVMVFQLEGDDATLQEGFKTISTALSRVLPAPPVRMPRLLSAPGLPIEEAEVDQEEPQDLEQVEQLSSNGNGNASGKTGPKKPPRSPIILDVDLTGGDMPLKAFLGKYSGDEMTKRYLLVAYWYKFYRNTDQVSADHIHTAFRHMGPGWSTPRDAAQPLRDLKQRQQWFNKGDRGQYKINHIGENVVHEIIGSES
jgi:hypothetical protein